VVAVACCSCTTKRGNGYRLAPVMSRPRASPTTPPQRARNTAVTKVCAALSPTPPPAGSRTAAGAPRRVHSLGRQRGRDAQDLRQGRDPGTPRRLRRSRRSSRRSSAAGRRVCRSAPPPRRRTGHRRSTVIDRGPARPGPATSPSWSPPAPRRAPTPDSARVEEALHQGEGPVAAVVPAEGDGHRHVPDLRPRVVA
jgi:hypothetical protein